MAQKKATRKVKAAGIGVPGAIFLTWLIKTLAPEVVIPIEVGAAIGSLISTGLALVIDEKD